MPKTRASKRAPTKAAGRGGLGNLVRRILASPWKLLRVLVAILLVVAVFFFHSIILETVGFGIVLFLIWAMLAILVVWQRRMRSVVKWWNFWLGALVLTLAVWGILGLIRPEFAIGDVDFQSVTLGGSAGAGFIGNQGAGAPPALRLALIILCGVAILVPYPSFRFTRRLAGATKIAASETALSIAWLASNSWRLLRESFARHRPRRRVSGPVAGKALKEGAGISTSETELTAPRMKPSTGGIQLPLSSAPVEEAETKQDDGAARRRAAAAAKVELPPPELLDRATEINFATADNERRARLIEEALASYGVEAKVVQINPGPSVTQFGLEPGWVRKYKRVVEHDPQGKVRLDKDGNPVTRMEEVSKTRVKVERITALANNLALALATPNIRIEAPVPGKPVVGVEVPNTTTSIVRLRGVMESPVFQKLRARSPLPLALGNGAAGEPVAADLTKMPHLLIAGATGSGKTVCINSVIACLLMCNPPEDLRLLLIDPKRVELVSFNGVPHLISPVVTDVEKAIEALRRVMREMDNRFTKFASVGVRNIEGYNRSPLVTERIPHLVVIVDELADLMMSAAEVVEPAICRLAQLARATGIHLILATQRPSVDVVTGLIKANFPTRISFAVVSSVDSRTILDVGGAEKLLGQGDMLYVPPEAAKPKRLRGCFVADHEIDRIVRFWKERSDKSLHLDDAVAHAFAALASDEEEARSTDPLLASARRLAKEHSHVSTSLLQRRLHIGYPRAARLMDALEEEGTVIRDEDGVARQVIGVDEEEEV